MRIRTVLAFFSMILGIIGSIPLALGYIHSRFGIHGGVFGSILDWTQHYYHFWYFFGMGIIGFTLSLYVLIKYDKEQNLRDTCFAAFGVIGGLAQAPIIILYLLGWLHAIPT
jgi:hypothetical protein